MRMCHFRTQNNPICPEQNFWYKPLLLLSSIYWPFSLCKILKKFLQQIWSYEDVPFLGPKWSICPKQKLFWKIINITLIYLLAPFIVQNLKKLFQQIQSYEDAQIFRQMIIFFRKPVNEPCFFQSCLSTCSKSKSDNLSAKCWRLKNTEISLAENNFWL